MTIKEDLVAFKNNIDLRTRFINYITDTTIDLNERWEAYLEAPHDLLEHKQWIVVFNSEKHMDGGSIDWYEMFGVNRCQVVELRGSSSNLPIEGLMMVLSTCSKRRCFNSGWEVLCTIGKNNC